MIIIFRRSAPIAYGLRLVTPLVCLLLAGCHISHSEKGKDENVEIGTPFGSMHLKTNEAANTAAVGLTPYPGATQVEEHNGKSDDAADIDMSFGSFHLGVKAASFQTQDPQDKVLAFYRRDLARYGDVIECRGNSPVSSTGRTSQGLTCDDKYNAGIHLSPGNQFELRAGSEQHQHIVTTESKNGGTRIELVALDLPSQLSGHGSGDVE